MGHVTYFSLSFSSHPNDFLSTNEKYQRAAQVYGKEGKEENEQGFVHTPPASASKMGSNAAAGGKHPEMDAERCWGTAGYPGGTKHPCLPSSPPGPAAPPRPPGRPLLPAASGGRAGGLGGRDPHTPPGRGRGRLQKCSLSREMRLSAPERFPAREQIRRKR